MTRVPHSLENTKWGENISEGALFLLQNSIISFEHVDSYTKIFLILYPPLGNFTARIAIVLIPTI